MNTKSRRVVVVSLAFAFGAAACSGQSPSAPAGSPPPGAPRVTSVSPPLGSTVRPTSLTISGTGFLPGATVTIGGVAARVTLFNSTTIWAEAAARDAGPTDVVVVNPDGLRGTLHDAFTYVFHEPFTVTPSTGTVDPGGVMTVSWTAAAAREGDWLAVFLVGGSYDDEWWGDTKGATSGMRTLTAPTRPGQYEFRYLLDDTFRDAARSSPFTVR